MAEFEVKYTFGIEPLQQYLVPFEGGKYQTLALTWDTEKKEWYHMADAVYPGQDIDHANWLHWTNQAQNWNGMCADCHSTNLKKGYDLKTDTYNTTWSEIDVNCEACHGPASFHLDWAKLPELARPQDNNTALIVQTGNIDNIQYVNLCARCHARRSTLKDYDFKWHDPLDHMIPAKNKLQSIAVDELYPVIVRATAISLLGEYYTGQGDETLISALYDPEALIRQTAIRSISLSVENIIELLVPLLNDYVKAVRIEAAIKLSLIPQELIPSKYKKTLEATLNEYRIVMEFSADFAASRHNLGNYYSNRNKPDNIDFIYALADFYIKTGNLSRAKIIVGQIIEKYPNLQLGYDLLDVIDQ